MNKIPGFFRLSLIVVIVLLTGIIIYYMVDDGLLATDELFNKYDHQTELRNSDQNLLQEYEQQFNKREEDRRAFLKANKFAFLSNEFSLKNVSYLALRRRVAFAASRKPTLFFCIPLKMLITNNKKTPATTIFFKKKRIF